jgi:hypothetical protein
MEKSGYGLTEVLFWHLLGGAVEIYENHNEHS